MAIYKIEPEKQGKITGPWNRGHSDLQKYEVTDSVRLNNYPQYDTFLFDWVEEQGKINGPWNIGHSDLQNIWGHSQCKTEQVPKVWCLSIRLKPEI